MKHILMIKECKLKGLKYLCKTHDGKDPYKYQGSGTRWVNHLKKYHKFWTRSKDISTKILGVYDTKEELKEAGLYYSELFDVVKSQEWANIIPEQGEGGWINDQTGKHWKIKDTSNMKGPKSVTKAVVKGRQKISGEKNYQFKGWYVTPYGKFSSGKLAIAEGKILRQLGIQTITDGSTLRKYCRTENTVQLNKEGRRTPKEWRGKTPKELGFDFIPKDML